MIKWIVTRVRYEVELRRRYRQYKAQPASVRQLKATSPAQTWAESLNELQIVYRSCNERH